MPSTTVDIVTRPRYTSSAIANEAGRVTRTIYHIRHGQTDWNRAGRLQGSQDIPLNAVGQAKADANGRTLGAHFRAIGRDPASLLWVVSPLGRTRETMERVRAGAGLAPADYTVETALREVSFGRFEGLTYAEIERHAPAAWAELARDKWHFLPPDGESYVMMAARVRAFVEGCDGDMVIVSHGGVFRALRSVIEHLDDPALAHLFVPQDRIFRWQDRAGAWL